MKKSCASGLILLLIILCGIGFLYFLLVQVPVQTQKSFGTPSSSLTRFQTLRYQVELFLQKRSLLTPINPDSATKVTIEVQSGDTIQEISNALESSGLIADASVFSHLLIYAGLDTVIQSGRFQFSTAESPVEIAVRLSNPYEAEIPFSVLAGWRLEEIAASLPASGFQVTGEEFLAIANNPSAGGITPAYPEAETLAGLIPPGITYLKRDATLQDFINGISRNEELLFSQAMKDSLQGGGLSEYQAIILASIVQREAIQPGEMRTIASVFINRLREGMKLESDPTAQFALGYDTESGKWWKSPLSLDDLKVNSPYNTYLVAGLPPAPISSPSREALEAVAFPEDTSFLFFQAKCDGSGYHNFAVTFEEHLANSCQ